MARMRQIHGNFGELAEGGIDPNEETLAGAGQGMIGIEEEPPIPGEEILRELPGSFNPKEGQHSEGPRDRETGAGGGGRARPRTPPPPTMGGGPAPAPSPTQPTPTRPIEPTPGAGHPSGGPGGGGGGGVVPFEPLPPSGPMSGSPVFGGGGAQLRGLLGSQGGLSGGGLGLPFDPVADEKSDPIALLMAQLMGQGQ